MPQDKIDLLYKDLQGEYDLGSIDDFKSYLSDNKKRELFFNEIVKPRYDVTDIGVFEDTYGLKKKEPAIGLGYGKPSEALRMGGLPKQEKLSQSPLKTAATITPSVSTKKQWTQQDQKSLIEKIKTGDLTGQTPEEDDYLSRIGSRIVRGMNTLNYNLSKTPEFVYNLAAYPQNVIAEKFDIPALAVSADKVKKELGIQNEVADYYKDQINQLASLDDKYMGANGSVTNLAKEGKYLDAAKLLGEQIAESLPTTAAIAASGGLGASSTAITLGGGAVFGAAKYDELADRTDLTESQKTSISFATGLTEGLFENLGTGNIGRIVKDVITKQGAAKGKEVAKGMFITAYKDALKKYMPVSGALQGGIEEAATTFAQNAIDIYTGVDPQKKLSDGLIDAFAVGTGSDFIISSPVLLSKDRNKKVAEKQVEVDEIDSEINNPNLSDDAKATLSQKRGKIMSDINDVIDEDVNEQRALPDATKREIEQIQDGLEQIGIDIENTKSEFAKKELESKRVELENRIDELTKTGATTTDGKGRTKEAVSAGTDVLETGVGMAAEPGKERVAGEDIQAEAVPQAPLEEQKAEIEKRRENDLTLNSMAHDDYKAQAIADRAVNEKYDLALADLNAGVSTKIYNWRGDIYEIGEKSGFDLTNNRFLFKEEVGLIREEGKLIDKSKIGEVAPEVPQPTKERVAGEDIQAEKVLTPRNFKEERITEAIDSEKEYLEKAILSEEQYIAERKNKKSKFRKILDKLSGVTYDKYLKAQQNRLSLLNENPLAYFEKELADEKKWQEKHPEDANENLINYLTEVVDNFKSREQAEEVPQAPVEEQQVPEEITNEYLLKTLPKEKSEGNTGEVMITTDKFGSTKTRYIPFEIIEQANKNDKLGGQTAKEINDRGGYSDKELDRKLPNWRTMLSKPEVEKPNIILSGLSEGFKGVTRDSFDIRSDNDVMEEIRKQKSFAKIITKNGKKYIVVGLYRKPTDNRSRAGGRDDYSFAMVEYNSTTPSDIVTILEGEAKNNFKNIYRDFNDTDVINPITKKDSEISTLEKQQVPEVVSEKVTEVTAPAIEVTPTAGSVGVGGDVEVRGKSNTGIFVNTTAHKLVGEGMNFFNRALGQFLPEFITREKGTEKNAEAKDEYTELTQEQANKIYDNLLNAADEGKISAESFVTRIKAVKSYLETVDTPKAKELLSKLNDVLPNLEANIEKLQKDTKAHLDDKAKGGKGDIDNVWEQRKQFEKLDLSALKTDDLFEAVEQSLKETPTAETKPTEPAAKVEPAKETAKTEAKKSKPEQIGDGLLDALGLEPVEPAKKAGKAKPVNVSNKSELSELEGKAQGDKKTIIEAAKKAIATLKSIFPEMEIYIHEDTDSYNETMSDVGGVANSRGNFAFERDANNNPTGRGRIDINLSNAKDTTVAHELVHAVLLKAFGDNPTMFKAFRDRMSKILRADLNEQVTAFEKLYAGQDVAPEEYLTELAALLSQGGEKVEYKPSTLRKVAALINEFVSRITKGKFQPFKSEVDFINFVGFLNQISGAISEGGEIDDTDVLNGGGEVGTFNFTSKGQLKAPKATEDSRDFIRKLVEDVDIREFNGKKFVTNMYDYTTAGVADLGNGFEINMLGGKNYVPYMMSKKNKAIGEVSNLAAFNTKGQAESFVRNAKKGKAELFAPHSGTLSASWQFQQHTFAELVNLLLDKGIMNNAELINTFNKTIESSQANQKAFEAFKNKYKENIQNFDSFKSDPKEIVKLLDIQNNYSPDLRKALNNAISADKTFQKAIGVKNKEEFFNKIIDPLNKGVTGGELINVVKFDPNTFEIVQTKPDAVDHHPSFGWTLLAKINGIYQPTEFHKSSEVTNSYTKYNKGGASVSRKATEPSYEKTNVSSSAGAIPKIAKLEVEKTGGIKSKAQVDVYHGSPYDFDKFTTEKIGTGEGAQAFGWGLYFTDVDSIAKMYAERLGGADLLVDGKVIKRSDGFEAFTAANGVATYGYERALERNIELLNEGYLDGSTMNKIIDEIKKLKDKKVEFKKKGVTYKVSLHEGKTPDQYTWLEWDKKLTDVQFVKILQGLGITSMPNTEKLKEIQKREKEAIENGDDKLLDKLEDEYFIEAQKVGKQKDKLDEELFNKFGIRGNLLTGEDWYRELNSYFKSDKKASLFLLENGIDGIKYPAESISRGATSDTARGFNYVVFDENAVTIKSKAQKAQTDKIKEFIDAQRKAGQSDKDIKAGLELVADKVGLTPEDINNLMGVESDEAKPLKGFKPKDKAAKEAEDEQGTEEIINSDNTLQSVPKLEAPIPPTQDEFEETKKAFEEANEVFPDVTDETDADGIKTRVKSIIDAFINNSDEFDTRTKQELNDRLGRFYDVLSFDKLEQIGNEFIEQLGGIDKAVLIASDGTKDIPPFVRTFVLGQAIINAKKEYKNAKTEAEKNKRLDDQIRYSDLLDTTSRAYGQANAYIARFYELDPIAVVRKIKRKVQERNELVEPTAKKKAAEIKKLIEEEGDFTEAINEALGEALEGTQATVDGVQKEIDNLRKEIAKKAGKKYKRYPVNLGVTKDQVIAARKRIFGSAYSNPFLNPEFWKDALILAADAIQEGAVKINDFYDYMNITLKGKYSEAYGEIYQRAKGLAVEKGANESDFSTNEEVQEELDRISKESDAKKIAKLTALRAKAAAKREENASKILADKIIKDANKELDNATTQKEKDAISKIIQVLAKKAKEATTANNKPKSQSLSDLITFVLSQAKKGEEIWKQAQKEVFDSINNDKTLSDDKKLDLKDFLDNYRKTVFDVLLTRGQKDKVIKEKLIELGYAKQVGNKIVFNVDDIIAGTKSTQEAIDALITKISEETGIPEQELSDLKQAFKTRLDDIIVEKKKAKVDAYLKQKERYRAARLINNRTRKTRVQKLIELYNAGGLTNDAVKNELAEELGIVSFTAEDEDFLNKKLQEADDAPSGAEREKIEEEIQAYLEVKDADFWLKEVAERWRARLLSGFLTAIKNLSGFYDTATMLLQQTIFTNIQSLSKQGTLDKNVLKVILDARKAALYTASDILLNGGVDMGNAFSELTGSKEGTPRVRYIEYWKPFFNPTSWKNPIKLRNKLKESEKFIGRTLSFFDTINQVLLQETKTYTYLKDMYIRSGYSAKEASQKAYDAMNSVSIIEATNQATSEFDKRGIAIDMTKKEDRARFKRRVYEIVQQSREKEATKAGIKFANRYTYKSYDTGIMQPVAVTLSSIKNLFTQAAAKIRKNAKDFGINYKVADKVASSIEFLGDDIFMVYLPFIKGIANILEKGFELNPYYGLTKSAAYLGVGAGASKDFKQEYYQRSGEYLFRAIMGTVIVSLFLSLADDDDEENKKLFGAGQEDYRKQAASKVLRPANTIVIAGRRINLDYLGSYGISLKIEGAFADLKRYDDEYNKLEGSDKYQAQIMAALSTILYSGYTQAIYEAIAPNKEKRNVVQELKVKGAELLTRATIPFANTSRQLYGMIDPESKKPISMSDYIAKYSGVVAGWTLDRPNFDYRGRTFNTGQVYSGSPDAFIAMFKETAALADGVDEFIQKGTKGDFSFTTIRKRDEKYFIMDKETSKMREMTDYEYYDVSLVANKKFDKGVTEFYNKYKNNNYKNDSERRFYESVVGDPVLLKKAITYMNSSAKKEAFYETFGYVPGTIEQDLINNNID